MTLGERGPVIVTQGPTPEPARQGSAAHRMKEYFWKGWHDWARELLEYKYLIAASLALIVLALYLDYWSGVYVSSAPSAGVPDLILDSFEAVDLNPLFVYGYIALIVGIFVYPLFFHIRTLHVVVSQFSFLLILRSVLMIFTHLQTPPGSIPVSFP